VQQPTKRDVENLLNDCWGMNMGRGAIPLRGVQTHDLLRLATTRGYDVSATEHLADEIVAERGGQRQRVHDPWRAIRNIGHRNLPNATRTRRNDLGLDCRPIIPGAPKRLADGAVGTGCTGVDENHEALQEDLEAADSGSTSHCQDSLATRDASAGLGVRHGPRRSGERLRALIGRGSASKHLVAKRPALQMTGDEIFAGDENPSDPMNNVLRNCT
jgi:hypothetical protein